MDEYLSEKEQIEQIKTWWRENGWYLIGGALIAGLGYFGYDQYQQYKDREGEEAAALYQRLQQNLDEDRPVDEILAELESGYAGSPYTDQAHLLVASDNVVRDPDRSITELRAVMENGADPGLRWVARTRLARVLAYRERYDEALAVLDVEDPGDFAARFSEIRGDIYAAQGDVEAARSAYTSALTEAGAEVLDRNFVQMKLSDLPRSGDGA